MIFSVWRPLVMGISVGVVCLLCACTPPETDTPPAPEPPAPVREESEVEIHSSLAPDTVVHDISGEELLAMMNQPHAPTVVFVYRAASAPCVWIRPRLDHALAPYTSSVEGVAVNLDAPGGSAVEQRFRIISVPTFIFLRDGQEQTRITGMPSRESLVYHIQTRLL